MSQKGTENVKDAPLLRPDSLINLLRKLYAHRKLIVRNTVIGGILGVAIALGTHKTWTSSVVLAPELGSESGLGGGLSSLASMAGLSLGATSTDALYPELYPQIVGSTPFVVGLLNVEVETLDGKVHTTLYDYAKHYEKMSWAAYPMHYLQKGIKAVVSLFVKNEFKAKSDEIDPFYLSLEQKDLVESIRNHMVSAFVNKSDMIITLSATTQDPLVSATLVDSVRARLQDEIIAYRTKKARHDMEYYERLVNESKEEYKRLEHLYANYSDSHQNAMLTSVKAQINDLDNQMQIAFNVYSQMVQQYEASKAKVQEATPSFTIVEPTSVSVKPSSTPKLVVAFVWTFLFFFFTSVWILVRDVLGDWKRKIIAPVLPEEE